jgi:hypothetical protein
MPTRPPHLPETHAGEVGPCHNSPRRELQVMWLPLIIAESAIGNAPWTLRAADLEFPAKAPAGRWPSTPTPSSFPDDRPVLHRPHEASNAEKQRQRARLPVRSSGAHLHSQRHSWARPTASAKLPAAASEHGGQVDLPTIVEQLLIEVVADGFTLYRCGPKAAPHALLACYEWDDCVDLLTIVDFDRIATARVPKRDVLDIFAPEVVVWAYEGLPQHALRALLDLVHPAHPHAPVAHYPAPPSLHIPPDRQRPMRIRLPSPDRARTRAARLTAAMTSPQC